MCASLPLTMSESTTFLIGAEQVTDDVMISGSIPYLIGSEQVTDDVMVTESAKL